MSAEVGPPTEVRRYRRADREPAIGMLCRSFADDPFYGYLVPDAAARERFLVRYWDVSLRLLEPLGMIEVAADPGTAAIVGLAAWIPPVGMGRTLLAMARSVARFGPRAGRCGRAPELSLYRN